jgi:neogenin
MGHGGQLSNNISYSTGISANDQLIASPNSNTLSKRGGGHQHPLKSFVPAVPLKNSGNQPKHIAVRPQLITSPLKKMPPVNGNYNSTPGKAIVTPTTRVKDEDTMSTYSTEELNQEMANLEGLMKDLNAITASEFEVIN